jgi:hypothetical protein
MKGIYTFIIAFVGITYMNEICTMHGMEHMKFMLYQCWWKSICSCSVYCVVSLLLLNGMIE